MERCLFWRLFCLRPQHGARKSNPKKLSEALIQPLQKIYKAIKHSVRAWGLRFRICGIKGLGFRVMGLKLKAQSFKMLGFESFGTFLGC